MSKKPEKTAPRAASSAAAEARKAATKRPAAASTDGNAERIARALEAIAAHLSAASPAADAADSFGGADAFVWHPDGRLSPVPRVSRVDLGLLKGIDRMRDILVENTERFADGLPANNALLWGARGMGKSSLVKAAHASINARPQAGRPAEADRDSSRGYREPARPDGPAARLGFPLHRVLRRPVVRRQRCLLQVAEGGAGGRHRGPSRQRDPVRDLQPPASVGARDDRERTLDRDQSRRSGRGKGLAVGPLRSLARLSPLQPG